MLENDAHNSRSQKTLLVTLLTAAIVILLFPLTAFSPVSQYSAAHTIIEIGVEFILLPFLAGSLGSILIGSSIVHRRLSMPAIEQRRGFISPIFFVLMQICLDEKS
jgi:hypothetical protein